MIYHDITEVWRALETGSKGRLKVLNRPSDVALKSKLTCSHKHAIVLHFSFLGADK